MNYKICPKKLGLPASRLVNIEIVSEKCKEIKELKT
ncbi:MAG: hypothetical protein ACI81I_000514 [Arcobacteraceae bacterium]|jgi:hypothetical protein